MERKTFKQKWNETDEVCPSCGQVTKVNRGLTKQNINKLFRKPTFQDWVIFIMLVLVLFGALEYQNEVEQYKAIIKYPGELCRVYYESMLRGNFGDINVSDIPNIRLIENDEIK